MSCAMRCCRSSRRWRWRLVPYSPNHSSHHTESIITENAKTFEIFYKNIDSAIILQNASTQFADGGEFGFGAEIGISTDKLHVRGPVGSEHLISYKSSKATYHMIT